LTIDLDVAATLNAVLWPIVVLAILLAYRQKIPALFERLASRVTKLKFAGVSLELATAKPFVPEWSGSPGALDLRHKATAIEVNDSTARTFVTQLMEEASGDYAEVNLGAGDEWLTSRLFIMAILFTRMKGIECFVFVEKSGDVRKRFVGWAEPGKIRWALAKRHPWLEQAYAGAYSTIMSQQQAFVVSNQGRLGYQFSLHDPAPSIELLREFLQRVQAPVAPLPAPVDLKDWILLDPATNTHEHAEWVTGELLEALLGADCNVSAVRSAELRAKNTKEQLQALLAAPERFVAVTAEDGRFEYLVDRNVMLEQVAKTMASDVDSRG